MDADGRYGRRCHDVGAAGHIVQDCYFSERVARSQLGHRLVTHRHCGPAIEQDEKPVARLALSHELGTFGASDR
jgi:hypothetical protein